MMRGITVRLLQYGNGLPGGCQMGMFIACRQRRSGSTRAAQVPPRCSIMVILYFPAWQTTRVNFLTPYPSVEATRFGVGIRTESTSSERFQSEAMPLTHGACYH